MNYWWMLAVAVPLLLLGGAAVTHACARVLKPGSGFIFGIGMVVGISGLIFGVLFGAYNLDRHACLEKGERIGRDTTYRALSGCFVNTFDHDQIPLDNWYENTGN